MHIVNTKFLIIVVIYGKNCNIYLSPLSIHNIGEVSSVKEELIIKKKLKGEDGFKTFSIRIKEETVLRLDELSEETNRSRNELINILLDFSIDHCTVK